MSDMYAYLDLFKHSHSPLIYFTQFVILSQQAPVKIAVIFKQLRVLIDSVLRKKLENPKMSLESKCLIVM
jgi:hypothetical protein